MLERLICFALEADCVDSGWAAHAHSGRRMNVERLICFALEGRLRGIQAGLHTRSAAAGPHECWSVLYFFALRTDCVDSGWAAHAQRRGQRMNVGASPYFFALEGRLRGIQAGAAHA
jgi:hypothetical protein